MRVVVSLTTIPSRLPYIEKTILNILNQTKPPDLIYLNLPFWSIRENQGYYLPPWSNPDLNSKVKIIRSKDYGPITKLYPVLQYEKNPETLIITFDDDIEYALNRIETLVYWAQKFPDSAIGGSGFILGCWWNFYGQVHLPEEPTLVSVIEGYSGCLYRRKFFSDDLVNFQGAPDGAFLNDDVWISGYLSKRKIPRIVHPSETKFLTNKRLPNALSANKFKVVWQMVPVIIYFRSQGLFDEKQLPPWKTIGFWVILSIVIVLIILFL